MCQTTTEPVFPFIKHGRGSWEPLEGGRVLTSKASSPESQPQPSRSALGLISWTHLALTTEVFLVCSEKILLCFSTRRKIPPSLNGVWPFRKFFHICSLAPMATPCRAFVHCCSHITDGNSEHEALWRLARAHRGLASQPLFSLKGLARLPWGGDSCVTRGLILGLRT